MTRRWVGWASFAVLASTQACLASKNDIRLLQDEMRVSRAAEAHADSARAAQGDSLRRLMLEDARTMDNLFAEATRLSRATADSLAALSNRVMEFQANTREALELLGQTVVSVRAQNQAQSNNLAAAQKALEDLKGRMSAGGAPSSGAPPGGGQAQQDSFPPPANLIAAARSDITTGACKTAREIYGDFLQHYPTDPQAAEAQAEVAQTFSCEGNSAAADSVYLVVATRYPGSDQAGIALFQHARVLCRAGKTDSAAIVLRRIVKEDTLSTARPDAQAAINKPDPCAQ